MKRRRDSRSDNLSPHPAPGDLRLIQDFLNTRDDEAARDDFNSPGGLSAWLAQQGLLPAGTVLDEAAWRSALDVREGLRALLLARNGVPLDQEAVERLNCSVAKVHPRIDFEPDGSVRLLPIEADWHGALMRLVNVIFDATVLGQWDRLKACHNPTCRWAFYDASRGRRGKWCTALRCGNRINTRTYRQRRP